MELEGRVISSPTAFLLLSAIFLQLRLIMASRGEGDERPNFVIFLPDGKLVFSKQLLVTPLPAAGRAGCEPCGERRLAEQKSNVLNAPNHSTSSVFPWIGVSL